jgi:hypothetical protein
MTRSSRGLAHVMIAATLTACATARPPVFGRPIEVTLTTGREDASTRGELLAVGESGVWVLGANGVREIPFAEIQRVRVGLHGLNGRAAGTWAGGAAVGTIGALAVACSQVEGTNCGGVLLLTAIPWALVGIPSVASLERSSRVFVGSEYREALVPYARFPQGLPEGLDPQSLAVRPRSTK